MQLTKSQALLLLSSEHDSVSCFDAAGVQIKINSAQAIVRLHRGNYRISGSKRRVKKIVAIPQATTWARCYRNTEAPVLPVSPEWQAEMGYRRRRSSAGV